MPHVAAADLPPVEEDAALEPGLRKAVQLLRGFEDRRRRARNSHRFRVLRPMRWSARMAMCAIEVERTQLVDGKAVGTGEFRAIPADLVVSCIGYQTAHPRRAL
jgi:ferredoxin--NADP+ reductase